MTKWSYFKACSFEKSNELTGLSLFSSKTTAASAIVHPDSSRDCRHYGCCYYKGFIDFSGVQNTSNGGRSQESNLPRTAGGPNWI